MAASIFGFITFIIGGFTGFAVYHYFFRLSNQEKKLLEHLNKAEKELRVYQEEVAEHLIVSAHLMDPLQETSRKLHDHILHASVALNRSAARQSILQPTLHTDPFDTNEGEEEQVTEFHPDPIDPKKPPIAPPRDYI